MFEMTKFMRNHHNLYALMNGKVNTRRCHSHRQERFVLIADYVAHRLNGKLPLLKTGNDVRALVLITVSGTIPFFVRVLIHWIW